MQYQSEIMRQNKLRLALVDLTEPGRLVVIFIITLGSAPGTTERERSLRTRQL